jgi:hypothetical protein
MLGPRDNWNPHMVGNNTSYTLHIWGISQRVQARIKGFVGPRHFSFLGPFGDAKSIIGTTVYSLLSGLMEGEGMQG